MTLIACRNATEEQTEAMLGVFNEMGLAMLIEEKQFAAATSLASCGIAYVMKYVQAAMQAGVEAGLRPAEAKKMVAQTLDGAARLLLRDEHTHPAIEIEKSDNTGWNNHQGSQFTGARRIYFGYYQSILRQACNISILNTQYYGKITF